VEPNLLRKAVEAMSRGPFTSDSLARELGIPAREAEALIGALLAHGYLREVEWSTCASCPLSGSCTARNLKGVKVYELTGKAAKLGKPVSPG